MAISRYLRSKALETILIMDRESDKYNQKLSINDVPSIFVTSSKEQPENVAFLEMIIHEEVDYYICHEISLPGKEIESNEKSDKSS